MDRRRNRITLGQLTGTGDWLTPAEQIKLPRKVLEEISKFAQLAWR